MGNSKSQEADNRPPGSGMSAYCMDKAGDMMKELQPCEVDKPEPAAGEVRIAVYAAAVNPIDCWRKASVHGDEYPAVPGSEGAGVVDAVGPDVTNVKVGDKVAFILDVTRPFGAFAAFAIASEALCFPFPAHLTWAQAAVTLPTSWLAWHLLTVRLVAGAKAQRSGAKETLLLWGSGGGCGLDAMVVQMASRVLGLTCYVICPPNRARFFESLGAECVYPTDSADVATYGAALRSVIEATDDRGVDHALLFDDASAVDTALTVRCGGNVVVFGEIQGHAALATRGVTLHCVHPPVLVQEQKGALADAAAAVDALFGGEGWGDGGKRAKQRGGGFAAVSKAGVADAAALPAGRLVPLLVDVAASDAVLDAIAAVTHDDVRLKECHIPAHSQFPPPIPTAPAAPPCSSKSLRPVLPPSIIAPRGLPACDASAAQAPVVARGARRGSASAADHPHPHGASREAERDGGRGGVRERERDAKGSERYARRVAEEQESGARGRGGAATTQRGFEIHTRRERSSSSGSSESGSESGGEAERPPARESGRRGSGSGAAQRRRERSESEGSGGEGRGARLVRTGSADAAMQRAGAGAYGADVLRVPADTDPSAAPAAPAALGANSAAGGAEAAVAAAAALGGLGGAVPGAAGGLGNLDSAQIQTILALAEQLKGTRAQGQ